MALFALNGCGVAEALVLPLGIGLSLIVDNSRASLNDVRIKNTASWLNRLADNCGFHRLSDLSADSLEKWLSARAVVEGMSAGNRSE